MNKNQSDSTNVFFKALEKTNDATKNLTSIFSHDSESSATLSPQKNRKRRKPLTESNIDQSNETQDQTICEPPKKKRANIRINLNTNQNDSTNAFFKALDLTDGAKIQNL